MALEIEGKVFKVLPEQSGEGRNGTWVKQEFVIETTDQYPKKICFSVWGDKTDMVKTLKIGENLKVSFNVESREFKEKWYTDLRAWKIDKADSNNQGTAPPPPITDEDIPPVNEEEDDLPF